MCQVRIKQINPAETHRSWNANQVYVSYNIEDNSHIDIDLGDGRLALI